MAFPSFAAPDASTEENSKARYESPLTFGLDLEYYAPVYKQYSYAVDSAGKSGISSMTGKAAQISLEWLPFGNRIGKLGVGISSGYAMISDGKIVQDSEEKTVSLSVVPSSLFLSYRFDYFKNQPLVPFIKLGGSASWVRQSIDGADSFQMAYGIDMAVGGEFCLNSIEPKAGREFDSRFGVNGTYLIAEYLNSDPMNKTTAVNLAYSAFRFGMRFEF